MNRTFPSPIAALIAVSALCTLAASCASSPGSVGRLELIQGSRAEATASPKPGEDPKPTPEPDKDKLVIRSNPSGAAVWIDGRYVGSTPLGIEGFAGGFHFIRIEHPSCKTYEGAFRYSGGTYEFHAELELITGFLELRGLPEGAALDIETSVGKESSTYQGKTIKLPIGKASVMAEAFGYYPVSFEARIYEDETTSLTLELKERPFEILTVEVEKPVINPADGGRAAAQAIRCKVSADGAARLKLLSPAGVLVLERVYLSFSEAWQEAEWDSAVVRPEPGTYTALVEGWDAKGSADREDAMQERPRFAKEAAFKVIDAEPARPRLSSAGDEGLILCPEASYYPTWRVGPQCIVTMDGQTMLLAPSISIGGPLFDGLRISAKGGALFVGEAPPAYSGDLTLTWGESPETRGQDGFYAGARLRASYDSGLVSLLNSFSGIGVAGLFEWRGAPFRLNISPELVIASVLPEDASTIAGETLYAYLVGRAGFRVDVGEGHIGLSAAARSGPLNQGLSLAWPVSAAIEGLAAIDKGSGTYVQAFAALNYYEPTRWYVMGGLSLLFRL